MIALALEVVARGARVAGRRATTGALVALPLAALASCDHAPGAPTSATTPERGVTSAIAPHEEARATTPAEPSDARLASDAAPRAQGDPPRLGALDGNDPLVALEVPAFRDAIVSLPLGATSARPVVVAAHGNYDRPEWQCGVWRSIVRERAFVLCPRGIPRTDSPGAGDVRFTYEGAGALAREVDAGLSALRARFGAHVAEGPILYTGFSLGAILGVPLVARDPARFSRAVLIEGGHDAWSAPVAKGYAARGGQRVLFACGQPACMAGAKLAATRLGKAGVATSQVLGPGVGHGYGGAVAAEVTRALDWVLEGDPRWE